MCVCLGTSLFDKRCCLDSNMTTTEHALSLSTTLRPSALGSISSIITGHPLETYTRLRPFGLWLAVCGPSRRDGVAPPATSRAARPQV